MFKAKEGDRIKITKKIKNVGKWKFNPNPGDICIALTYGFDTNIRVVPTGRKDYNDNDLYTLIYEDEYEVYIEPTILKTFKSYYKIPKKEYIPHVTKWLKSLGKTTVYENEDITDKQYNYLFISSIGDNFHFECAIYTDIYAPFEDLYKLGMPKIEEPFSKKTSKYKLYEKVKTKLGSVFNVNRITYDDEVKQFMYGGLSDQGSQFTNWAENEISLVEAIETEKVYKIGDRVIVGESNVSAVGWEGNVGTVVSICDNGKYKYQVKVEDGYCLYTEIIGLAPKEPAPQVDFESSKNIKPKFKITDKVLIQQGGFQYCEPTSQGNCIGFPTNNGIIEYIIEEFTYENGHFWYKLVDYGNWVTEGGLQKINTTTKEQPIPNVYNPTTKPTPKFKYLDLVRVDIHDGEFIVISSEYRYDTHFYVVESTGVEGRLNGISEDRISFAPILIPELIPVGEASIPDDFDKKALREYLGLSPKKELMQKENITLIDTNVNSTKSITEKLVSKPEIYYF
ncbi:MAG: hypothetical protein WCP46_00440 [Alphaproteobacteria bacterium]